jgi:hypothetical protein
MPLDLPETDEEVLSGLIETPEASAALARLFMAGATTGEWADNTRWPGVYRRGMGDPLPCLARAGSPCASKPNLTRRSGSPKRATTPPG